MSKRLRGKDASLPAPHIFTENWAACARACEKSAACAEYSFKADSWPTPKGCWLLPKSGNTMEADGEAVTGAKDCQETEAGSMDAVLEAVPEAKALTVDTATGA